MPWTPCAVVVEPAGNQVAVTIKRNTSGGATVDAYTSENGSSLHAFPKSISSRTEFWLASPGAFYVSMTVAGSEAYGKVVTLDTFGRSSISPSLPVDSLVDKIGPQIDYRDFAIRPDDDDYDSGSGLNQLLTQARAVGGVGMLGPGTYYADQTLVFNSAADQGSVGLYGASALGSLLGNKPTRIVRPVGSTHTMATALGRGVQIDGITFDGQSTTGDGLVVSRGFELSITRSRFVDIYGQALDLRALSNSRLERLFIDRCGTPSSAGDNAALHVRGNSSYEYVTNTLYMSDVHIERSSGTAFNLAYGNAVDDLAEFIRCYGLHIEQNINNSNLTQFTTEPVLKIGNVRGAWFYGTFIYGGSGPLVQYDKLRDNGGSAARGVKFFGGRLFGNVTSHAVDADTPPRLVDLVHGDNIEFHGVEFDTALTELVRIQSTFGKEPFFAGCEFLSRTSATTTGINDQRTDDTTHRGQMSMPGQLISGDTRITSDAAGRILSVSTAAAQAATVRFETAGVARIDIRKSSGAEAGSDAGSDFEIVRRSDDGTNLGTVLTITRSTGLTSLASGLTVVGTTTLAATTISGGDLTVSAASGARIVAIQRVAGQVGRLALRTGTSDRWHFNVNATAEGGSDAGSDLEIASRTDAGASKTTVLTITRSNGRSAFGGDVQLNDKNLIFGTTTGTQIGTASSQKLAFYGTTPIIRPTSTPAAATDLATALTLVNYFRTNLLALGLVA